MADEFKSHTSYREFSRSVMEWRYIRSPDDEAFLRHVALTAKKRIEELPASSTLWRAQVGCEMLDAGFDHIEVPFPARLMKPPAHWRAIGQSSEGRTNPTGIPFLYTATNEHIAISEVKPSPGHFVNSGTGTYEQGSSDCQCDYRWGEDPQHNSPQRTGGPERELAVWRDIDRAFSQPVAMSAERADYASTQILAELFRKDGLDGIAYRSAFGTGHNIALFDADAADIVACQLYRVAGTDVKYSASGSARAAKQGE